MLINCIKIKSSSSIYHTHTTARVRMQPTRWGEYKLEQIGATKDSSLLPSLCLCSDHSTICLSSFYLLSMSFPDSSAGIESACNTGDPGSIPGLGRFSGERKSYPLQSAGLENPMDCTVHWFTESDTTEWLHFSMYHHPASIGLSIHPSLLWKPHEKTKMPVEV